nr:uncharacterized protein LOC107413262 isoform X2 [Ziziphus jujuba var. spinosa]
MKLNVKMKQSFEIRCSSNRLSALVATFSEEKRKAVQEIGFGSLINNNLCGIRKDLCIWLVQKFDPLTTSIDLHGKVFKISSKDVERLMGLIDSGSSVELIKPTPDMEDMMKKHCTSEQRISIAQLNKRLSKATVANDDFKIRFTLFVIGTILCPGLSGKLPASYLHLLKNVDSIRQKNWASWTFSSLIESVHRYKRCEQQKSGRQRISGCILLLQLFYMDVVWFGKPLVDRSVMAIFAWGEVEVQNFMRLLQGRGGVGSRVNVREVDDKVCNEPRVSKSLNIENVEEHQMKADLSCMKGDLSCMQEDISWIEGAIEGLISKSSGIPKSPHGNSFGNKHGLEVANGNASLHPHSPIVEVQNQANIEEKHIVCVNSNNSSLFNDEQLQNFDMNALKLKENNKVSGVCVSVKQTQTLKERKPCLYMQSPFDKVIQGWVECQYHACLLSFPTPLKEGDLKIVHYIFDCNLDHSEVLVKTEYAYFTRGPISTLRPETWLDGDQMALRKNPDVARFAQTWQLKKRYMGSLKQCEKIFIPIYDESGHWYLLIVCVKEAIAEIWDPLPNRRRRNYREENARQILRSLDIVFADEIDCVFHQSKRFEDFNLEIPENLPKQPNGYDCGIFVIKYMEDSCIANDLNHLNNSVEERLRLVLQLVCVDFNMEYIRLMSKAEKHYEAISKLAPTRVASDSGWPSKRRKKSAK